MHNYNSLSIIIIWLICIISCLISPCNAVECKLKLNPRAIRVANRKPSKRVGDYPHFIKLQDAIDSIPSGNDRWIELLLEPGIYREQVTIPEDKPCIVIKGHGWDNTIITYDAHQETDTSPTIKIFAENVVVKYITFENSFVRKRKGEDVDYFTPAVALRVTGDRVAFYACKFKGYQDTLWDDKGRHYFYKCYIEGAVDFIWGDGQSFYELCWINVTDGGYITAQGRNSPSDTSGYVFNNCIVHGDGHGCLGRAYGPYSRVIFLNSFFSDVVDPQGWYIWNQFGHERDVIYAESNCTGPGVNSSERVPWMKKLHEIDLAWYTLTNFVDQEGWISKQPLALEDR